jgi:hypothetical protein
MFVNSYNVQHLHFGRVELLRIIVASTEMFSSIYNYFSLKLSRRAQGEDKLAMP